jgi:hypothetical protein
MRLCFSSLLLALPALAAGCLEPGFTGDADPGGPALVLEQDGAPGRFAVQGRGLGSVFGLSYHLVFDEDLLEVRSLEQVEILGGPQLARHIAAPRHGDVALGGSRLSREDGEALVEDGPLLRVELAARASGTSRVSLVDALARRADGSFIPLAAVGGSLTLEVAEARSP